MKKIISFLLLFVMMTAAALAAAEGIIYTATVTKAMTIREKKSTSAKKLGSVEAGEFISILSLDDKWAQIEKDGVTGYILAKNIENMASADGYNDAADASFLGVAQKALTIRARENKAAAKLQSLEEGETVYILELGREWHKVVKLGVVGYVLAGPVTALEPAHEGIVLPEEFIPEAPFIANYTAQADVNLSIRREPNANSGLVGTVYKNEWIDVMETDGEWARVQKDGVVGFVRGDHLRYFTRYDPYGPYVPGVVWYPYAARALQDVEITDSETGDVLRTVTEGSIMAVSAMNEDMSVTLPYDRITGRIQATGSLELEAVVPYDQAQMGDLIAVYSTYYTPEQVTQTQIGRLHNIMQGVERLNDVVIASDDKFYFNDFCAPYTKSNGYQEGPIINYVSSDKLGYGGGICQVSTTLYNAILQIPIETIKWQVHSSYGISYAPLYFDAAVGNGNIDLRLRNALPYDVRLALQAVGGVLTVRVYRAS
ncbi:MAG: VanW family protein [Clostridia bacterium]|nr:VanW family protein [Clostridia bacterium]